MQLNDMEQTQNKTFDEKIHENKLGVKKYKKENENNEIINYNNNDKDEFISIL